MAVTREEQAINALPPKLQQRMAMLCLAGWHFECLSPPATSAWQARKGGDSPAIVRYYTGYTLLTLIDQMDFEYIQDLLPGAALPDAAQT